MLVIYTEYVVLECILQRIHHMILSLTVIFVGPLSYEMTILIRSLFVTLHCVLLAKIVDDINDLLNEKFSRSKENGPTPIFRF